MKLKIQKAKHYWENKESATWIKSNSFDKNIFVQLKDMYESIKYSKPKYKSIDDKILMFFYHDTKDIFGRDITELSALLIDIKIKDKNQLYDIIKTQVNDLFNNEVDIIITIEDNLILKENNKKSKNILLVGVLFALILSVSIYFMILNSIVPAESSKPNSSDQVIDFIMEEKNTVPDKLSESNSPKSQEKNTVPNKLSELNKSNEGKITQKIPEWEWEYFCKKNNSEIDNVDLSSYIKEKCKDKDDFNKSFEEYVHNTLGITIDAFKNDLNKLSDEEKFFFGVKNEVK